MPDIDIGVGLAAGRTFNLHGARIGRMQDAIDNAQRRTINAVMQGAQLHDFIMRGANAGFDFADIERALASDQPQAIALDMETIPPCNLGEGVQWYAGQDALTTLELWRDRVLQEN